MGVPPRHVRLMCGLLDCSRHPGKRLMLVWLLPCGGFALWWASQFGLALLITVAPLEAGRFGAADAITLAYAFGMIEGYAASGVDISLTGR